MVMKPIAGLSRLSGRPDSQSRRAAFRPSLCRHAKGFLAGGVSVLAAGCRELGWHLISAGVLTRCALFRMLHS